MAYTYDKKYPEEIQLLLQKLVTEFEKDDYTVRMRQIRTWRRLKMLWENFQSSYYNEVAHDWRIPTTAGDGQDGSNDQAYYDKPVNVLRAYLESIIAALSVTVPGIKCYPDDADNILDINTAKAGDKISRLIFQHNDVPLLWLHSLFIYVTEGLIASYSRTVEKKEYGTYKTQNRETKTENHLQAICPHCGYMMDDVEVTGEPDPAMIQPQPELCESCGAQVIPEISQKTIEIDELMSEDVHNKARVHLDCYGGLNVKVPNWARKQEDCNYLRYSYETHYSNALECYPHLIEKFDCGIHDPYEVWGRLSPQYRMEYPKDNVTMSSWWFRPAAFNILKEQEVAKLKKLFPDGVRCDMVNEVYAGAEAEPMDDCWTLTYNPMSDYVHCDPIGLLLTSIQEMTNDLISLSLQTIEHGIGQTFADPRVLDFQGYKQMETQPGNIFPVKIAPGKSASDAFFEMKTATLSAEVMPFGQEIQNMGQLVSGALPSLFGGAMEEQKTASGYAMSRAQALQRLQNTWKMLTIWWKTTFSKAIPQYIAAMQDDERDVQKDSNGGFVNSFIRKAETEGKIGKYELEANESLPLTWSQRKDLIMQLVQINNPEILQTLWAPENRGILKEAIGLDDFFIPGEDDRNKQYDEIRELLASAPMPGGVDEMGTPTEVPSVDVDPDLDDHEIEFEICRSWLVGDVGRQTKVDNPLGYQNVLLHAKAHKGILQEQQMQQAMMEQQDQNGSANSGGNGAPPKKPKETDKQAPIESEADVRTQY